jgi:hypothetical protein
MNAYRKFSESFRRDEPGGPSPAKTAKPAKADLVVIGTLAELAGLARSTVEIGFSSECAEPLAPAGDGSAGTWGSALEERAAKVENQGGVPRNWAEGFARLDSDYAPADVPIRRWQTFVDDVGRFLDGDWAEKAAALGWGPCELFGADRDRPFARLDEQGLCWLINGGRLLGLSSDTAVIETCSGARHTYRRKPGRSSRTLAWELNDGSPSARRQRL